MLNQRIKSIFILMIIIIVSACNSKKDEAWLLSEVSNFESLIDNNEMFFSETVLEKRLENLTAAKEDLNMVDFATLSDASKVVYKKIENGISRELYLQDTLDVYHWNAAIYRFLPLVKGQFKGGKVEQEDFEAVNELLALSDSFYTIAKENISKSISINKGKLAIEEHRKDYLYLQNEFSKMLEISALPEELEKDIIEKVRNLQLQIKDYIGYVTSLINNIDDLDSKVMIVDEGDDLKKYAE